VTAPEQEEPPPEEDSGSLIPAILAAYGAYMTWRGANEALPTSWAQTALKLGLRALIALQLSRIAISALTSEQQFQRRRRRRTCSPRWSRRRQRTGRSGLSGCSQGGSASGGCLSTMTGYGRRMSGSTGRRSRWVLSSYPRRAQRYGIPMIPSLRSKRPRIAGAVYSWCAVD
jgi:hypothetical protein